MKTPKTKLSSVVLYFISAALWAIGVILDIVMDDTPEIVLSVVMMLTFFVFGCCSLRNYRLDKKEEAEDLERQKRDADI